MKVNYLVTVNTGINAKVAAQLVSVFNRFDEIQINVIFDSEIAEGKSILSLIGLLVSFDQTITIEAIGEKEELVFEALEKSLESHSPRVLKKVD
ncbi:MAG: HPr family phosphocarrier protein [Bacillales bacterium]|jgi:phosphotransferase system HPr (HPr) family protein|nr:HPr family phosphocarrier protein [Bacillales bacterium]